MRTTKKIISAVLAVCMLASASAISGSAAVIDTNPVSDVKPLNTKNAQKCQEIDDQYAYSGNDLGATYSKDRTVFKVWAPTATEVKLNLFATGSDSEPNAEDLGTQPLVKDETDGVWNGIWTVTVEGDLKNVYYTYTVSATKPTSLATAKPTTTETQDIYSVAVGVNGNRSMVCDLDSTDPEGWENDKHVLFDSTADMSVWEVHVKDFSYDKSSGVSEANRGKYLAFTEDGTTLNGEGELSTCIDYLKELGITTVQINPFYDYQSVNESGSDTQFNWGYDPKNYNVPEGSYSSNPYDGNVRIKECKQMIQALHNAGISVVMDVVYNHTYDTKSSFQATVPNYYYRINGANAFTNGSGCGNETASERAMFRNFMIQSCRYWVDEYHIDGFRFDLMGVHDVETMNLIRANLDEVDTRITTWGEGWEGGTSNPAKTTCTGETYYSAELANAALLSERVGFFNDGIRDGAKGSVFESAEPGFVQGRYENIPAVINGIQANTKDGAWVAKAPSQVLSYTSCHDNATLYDKIKMTTETGDYGVRNKDAVRINKLAAALIYTSQGTTFYLAGEEMCRTKLGDTNSYNSSPEINKIDWNNIVEYADVVSYYKGLGEIKSSFSPFNCPDLTYIDAYQFNKYDASKESAEIAYTVTNDQANEWSKVAVLFNGNGTDTDITLEDTSVTEWVVIANEVTAGLANLGEVSGSTFTVPAHSAIVAVDKASYESANIKPENETGYVKVNYVHENSGQPLDDPMIIAGAVGTSYKIAASSSIPDTYVLSKVVGEESGKFETTEKEVTYYYTDFVPDSVKNADFDGDGNVVVDDVTELQKSIADIISLPADKEALTDLNYDGATNIDDVTMLQKYLAGIAVSSGQVTVNYLYPNPVPKKDNEEDYKEYIPFMDPIVFSGRTGSQYTAQTYTVVGYELDKTIDQPSATGYIPYGNVEVTFVYKAAESLDIKLHVAHSGTQTWAPSLWIWGSDLNDKDTDNYTGGTTAKWPGVTLEDDDKDGWYDYEFTYVGAGSYNVIVSKNGSPQSVDYKGCVYNEMWIVIDDSVADSVALNFYLDNPFTNPDAPIASEVHPK